MKKNIGASPSEGSIRYRLMLLYDFIILSFALLFLMSNSNVFVDSLLDGQLSDQEPPRVCDDSKELLAKRNLVTFSEGEGLNNCSRDDSQMRIFGNDRRKEVNEKLEEFLKYKNVT